MILAEMEGLRDYRVRAPDADPRGWNVLAADQQVVGYIVDMIVDTEAEQVRYLVCALGPRPGLRRILIPTGFARIDEEQQSVLLDFLTEQDLVQVPDYLSLPLTTNQEEALESAFTKRPASKAQPSLVVRRTEN